MRALEEECAELGFDECCLVVEARNRRAQSLYKKLGYKVIGASEAAALEVVDGRAVETTTKTLIMRKSLTNSVENIDDRRRGFGASRVPQGATRRRAERAV